MSSSHVIKLQQLAEEELKDLNKYLGMLRLLRCVFTNTYGGNTKTWGTAITTVLDTLSDREKQILILRFGLGGEAPKGLDDTGKHFGVTRERIRQIEAKAIRKLKHPSRRFVMMGLSWQLAVQEAKEMGEKLLTQKTEAQRQKVSPLTTYDIETTGIPTRIKNALRKGGYNTTFSVAMATDQELARVKNIGERSVRIIRKQIPRLEDHEV